jgi:hypothetical protein
VVVNSAAVSRGLLILGLARRFKTADTRTGFKKTIHESKPLQTKVTTYNNKIVNCDRIGTKKKDLPRRPTNCLYSAPSGHGSVDRAECSDIAASPGIEPRT